VLIDGFGNLALHVEVRHRQEWQVQNRQRLVLAGMVGPADFGHVKNAGLEIVHILLFATKLVAIEDLDRELATGSFFDDPRIGLEILRESTALTPDIDLPTHFRAIDHGLLGVTSGLCTLRQIDRTCGQKQAGNTAHQYVFQTFHAYSSS